MSTHTAPTSKNSPDKTSELMPLIRWIWRSYLRTSLIPLLFVEVALIAIYFASNTFSTHENITTAKKMAEQQLTELTSIEAKSIDHQLAGISQTTTLLAIETARVMNNPHPTILDDPRRFKYSPDGVYYTDEDHGGGAVFYSSVKTIGEKEREKALKSAGLDPILMGITHAYPLIAQAYYNTHDSLNRIYPYFDVISQYEAKMDIPTFNFYYEADAAHNPEKKAVWTDVYFDPAGQGWMASCIAPVYHDSFLEGVVGVDVTVGTIVHDVLNLDIPWNGYGLLISREGAVIAMPKAGEADWLTNSTLEAFNFFNQPNNQTLAEAIHQRAYGLDFATLEKPNMIAWSSIPETDWKLLIVVPEANIFAAIYALSDRLTTIAWLMIVGMLFFYLIFFSVLYRRARHMSHFVSEPLIEIDAMIASIGQGHFEQPQPDIPVTELHATAAGIVSMGRQLHQANVVIEQSKDEIQNEKNRLQSVFNISPDAFIFIDQSSRVMLVNPAFLKLTGHREHEWLGLSSEGFWNKFTQHCLDRAPVLQMARKFCIELQRPKHLILTCEICKISSSHHVDAVSLNQGMLICMRDITHEEALNEMKNEFVSLAAHELGTPLASIIGFTELLMDEGIPEAMQKDSMRIISKQAGRLQQIISDLIDLNRIDARSGKDFHIASHSIEEVITHAIVEFKTPPERDPIQLQPVTNTQVIIDANKFKQVLHIILSNAYTYSKSGDICIDSYAIDAHTFAVRIIDHGMGIEQEDLPQIFDRFWRADKSGKVPGTGLGLCIARETMRLMHGDIVVHSQYGEGTEVILTLPIFNEHNPVNVLQISMMDSSHDSQLNTPSQSTN
ncbi:MAG: PAS domain-containing protein [Zetaproteobacteria bacterium]|nr:PAS domain-containing protein [Zetaproteobacteria bacterium]